MTFGSLKTLVWSWLDDVNGTYFTPAEVKVWINNAQREVQKLLLQAGENYYVLKMGGLTVTNQDTYQLPTDFRKCHKFEVVLSNAGTVNEVRNTMAPVTYQQLEQVSQSTGSPVAYCIKRNVVVLRPIPDQAYTIYMHQSYRVVDMSVDADLPDVPEDYQEFIAVLATLDGYMKDQRDPSAFIIAKRDYYLNLLKQDADDRDVSAPKSVVVTESFGCGSLF